jgi:aryl-alcohol dehydrogenase-like predicted oxidoreductase
MPTYDGRESQLKFRTLGRTDLQVSEIGLGTWSFASKAYGTVAQSDAVAVVQRALDGGINLFDTAPLYGSSDEDGISERILGGALGSRRDEVLISTKFGRASSLRGTAFTADGVRSSVEASLERLSTDRIDILFFHSPFGPDEIADDVWGALTELKSAGKVRCIGHSISRFSDTQAMARAWFAERKIDLVQVVYSLMNRESSGLIHDIGSEGAGVFARESLANGFLSGAITSETAFPDNNLNKRYAREELAERVAYVDSLRFLVRDEVSTLPQAALRWVLDNPDVSLVLSGARNVSELEDVLGVPDLAPFSADERVRAESGHVRDFEAA